MSLRRFIDFLLDRSLRRGLMVKRRSAPAPLEWQADPLSQVQAVCQASLAQTSLYLLAGPESDLRFPLRVHLARELRGSIRAGQLGVVVCSPGDRQAWSDVLTAEGLAPTGLILEMLADPLVDLMLHGMAADLEAAHAAATEVDLGVVGTAGSGTAGSGTVAAPPVLLISSTSAERTALSSWLTLASSGEAPLLPASLASPALRRVHLVIDGYASLLDPSYLAWRLPAHGVQQAMGFVRTVTKLPVEAEIIRSAWDGYTVGAAATLLGLVAPWTLPVGEASALSLSVVSDSPLGHDDLLSLPWQRLAYDPRLGDADLRALMAPLVTGRSRGFPGRLGGEVGGPLPEHGALWRLLRSPLEPPADLRVIERCWEALAMAAVMCSVDFSVLELHRG